MARPAEYPPMKEALRQTQESRLLQKLNPMQVRFGRILEMNTPEVEDEVRRELDENPALEEVASPDSVPEENGTDTDDFNETADELQLADYGHDDDIPSYRLSANNNSPDDIHYEAFGASDDEDSIVEAMDKRLAELDLDETERKIAAYITGNLDDNGYLTRPLDAIADDMAIAEGIDVAPATLKHVFDAIRTLDPAGICAVDLRDCILLQLQRLDNSLVRRTAEEIIDKHFDLFSKKHFEKLRTRLSVDNDVLQDALDLIRSLNPKPGSLLVNSRAGERMRHIVPDFSVDYDQSDGSFSVSLLSRVPELEISESFRPEPEPLHISDSRRREARAFIKRKYDEASSFITMMRMRSQTLLAVMRAIVERQKDFFITGDKSLLHPLILKDISASTGLDLSVISRAATGKYVLTAHGIYPLKLFFSERPTGDNDASSHLIMQTLTEIITAEDKKHPLSDEELRLRLLDGGLDIARRTVAKYRERLGLPVARLRKEF